ncbi:MAG: hypothetical protein K6B42_01760 [Clostridia bacterium]|nr:hypothetical protein [Clostridia bacterium]
MNKKVVMQVGCFLAMFVLEMIAAYINPASVMQSVLLILSLALIPMFVLIGRMPEASENVTVNNRTSEEASLPKAA